MRFSLGKVQTGFYGFQTIADLAHRMRSAGASQCEVDMSAVQWLDANMCAALGAVLHYVHCHGSEITLLNLPQPVEIVLRKNHFLAQFGGALAPDHYETTIEYRRFDQTPPQRREFQEYVNMYFGHGTRGLPEMTQALLKRFRESLFEIFENALEHSYTKYGVFTCGQHFPKNERLDFTVVDLGIGFHGNIDKKLGLRLSPGDAIQWALSGRTTRRGRPGGLGLRLLREFINLNGGRLIIVSDVGYCELLGGDLSTKSLSHPFPGSALTIEVDTADQSSYCLSTEVDPNEIF